MTRSKISWQPNAALAGLAALALLVAACGPIVSLSDSGPPPTLYTLPAPDADAATAALSGITLMVEEPSASDAFDGRRIALKPSPFEVQYYAGARWIDRAPRMIQNMLIATFAPVAEDVGPETMQLAPDYRLQTRLVDFHADYADGKTPTVVVTLEMRLFSRMPMALVASHTVSRTSRAAGDKMPAIINAFHSATGEALREAADTMTGAIFRHMEGAAEG